MATFSKGILGGFSGRVGNIVGARIFGIDVMRSYQPNVKNPRTPAQVAQRNKFSLLVAFISLMLPIIRTGFKFVANKMSEFNKAVSVNILSAVTGTDPNYQIDYPNVTFAQGSLTSAKDPALNMANPLTASLAWVNNAGVGLAADTDVLHGIVYNPTKDSYAYLDLNTRQDEFCDITVPADWATETVHAWGFFVSDDGSMIGDSDYFGSGVISAT